MGRDDPDEKMERDVQVRDGFGATSPGTRMVPCWLVWRLYKPKSETKPIQYVASKTKHRFGPKSPVTRSEMSRYPGRLLPRFAQAIKLFFVITRYKECQKNYRNISLRSADYFHSKTDF